MFWNIFSIPNHFVPIDLLHVSFYLLIHMLYWVFLHITQICFRIVQLHFFVNLANSFPILTSSSIKSIGPTIFTLQIYCIDPINPNIVLFGYYSPNILPQASNVLHYNIFVSQSSTLLSLTQVLPDYCSCCASEDIFTP